MSFKSVKEQLDQLARLSDKIVSSAEKLLSAKPDPESNIKDDDTRLINRFKQAELLSHMLAYTLNAKSKTQEVTDEDGVKREYIVKRIPSSHSGLVGFILYSEDPNNSRVHVLFRGTHNMSSARRNLETMGVHPGGHSFNRNKASVLKTIKEIVSLKQKQNQKPVELSIAGHSLGGADAQNCATAILEEISNTSMTKPSPLAKLGALNIMPANSAGVSHSTAKKCSQYLRDMRRKQIHMNINHYPILVGGDGVQQAGYTSILADAPSNQVNTYMLKADIGQQGKFANVALILRGKISIIEGMRGTYKAHTLMIFDQTQKANIKIRIYNNRMPGEDLIIEKNLTNKLYRKLNVFNPLYLIKKFAKSIHTLGAKFKRKTRKKY